MLLALADKADEHGVCLAKYDTSYETLADMVGVNRRSAMRLIDNLCKAGHICKIEAVGRGHSNTFLVLTGLEQEEIIALLTLNGVTDDTIYEPEKVLPETPNSKEMVLPVTLNGVTDDTNSIINGVTGNTQPIIKNPSNPSIPKNLRPVKSLAFQVYVERTEYYGVTKEWIEKMTSTVGDKPEDLIKWGNIVSTFTGRGKWKGNVKDMLGWFVDGIPVYSKDQNGSHPPANKSSPLLNKTRLEELQAESAKEIYDPLKGT